MKPAVMAAIVRAVLPDSGTGGGVAVGWQEASEVQLSEPEPSTVTHELF